MILSDNSSLMIVPMCHQISDNYPDYELNLEIIFFDQKVRLNQNLPTS